jgi:outer membrane biogenesis lipoprotein LolB
MRNQILAATLRCTGALLLLFLLAGCGGSNNNALNPQFQPQVANLPDTFQFQSTGVTGVTQSLHYGWQTSGTAASINQASTLTAGTATVTISDMNGKVVYTGDLSANGTFASTTGAGPGLWSIDVVLKGYSGTLNFRVQKM